MPSSQNTFERAVGGLSAAAKVHERLNAIERSLRLAARAYTPHTVLTELFLQPPVGEEVIAKVASSVWMYEGAGQILLIGQAAPEGGGFFGGLYEVIGINRPGNEVSLKLLPYTRNSSAGSVVSEGSPVMPGAFIQSARSLYRFPAVGLTEANGDTLASIPMGLGTFIPTAAWAIQATGDDVSDASLLVENQNGVAITSATTLVNLDGAATPLPVQPLTIPSVAALSEATSLVLRQPDGTSGTGTVRVFLEVIAVS